MKRLTQAGFSMIEISIALAMLSGLGFAVYGIFTHFQTGQRNQMAAAGLLGARAGVSNTLSSKEGFEAVLNSPKNSASFACIKNKLDCTGAGAKLYLVNKDGKPVDGAADPTDPSDGISLDGRPCNTFNSASPEEKKRCPLRYEAQWRAVCPPSPANCLKPSVELTAGLINNDSISATELSKINPSKYRVSFLRQETNDSVADICMSIDGTPVSTSECVTKFARECPVGQFVIGFTNQGEAKCGAFTAANCPAGQVVIGVSASGLKCGPGCDSNGSSILGNLYGSGGSN